MRESTVNVVLAAVVVAVAVVVVLVLLWRTVQSGAGLDAGWGTFLAFVFGFVLRRVYKAHSAEKESDNGENSEDDGVS